MSLSILYIGSIGEAQYSMFYRNSAMLKLGVSCGLLCCVLPLVFGTGDIVRKRISYFITLNEQFFVFMIRCMNVNETRGLCKDPKRWLFVVSTVGQRRESVYVCILIHSKTENVHCGKKVVAYSEGPENKIRVESGLHFASIFLQY